MTSLAMYRGDDRALVITASESLTGSEVAFTARRRKDGETIIEKATGAGITIGSEPDDEKATVTLAAADTADLEPGPLFWDVEVVDGSGATHTVATGILLIKADVTRSSQ